MPDRKYVGQKAKVGKVVCAYCGRRIRPYHFSDLEGKITAKPMIYRYTGEYIMNGYGRGEEVRFCNYKMCTLQFAINAYMAGHRTTD